ncbi:MAG: zinc ribbon domain-containing protein [Microthrixaceae bacterium]
MSTEVSACGHRNEPGLKYCGECGIRIHSINPCARGHENPVGQKYCGECGVALEAGDVSTTPETQALDEIVIVELIQKNWVPAMPDLDRYTDLLQMTFAFENLGDKDIRAFTGTVFFFDLFGREQMNLGLTVDTSVLSARTRRVEDTWSIELYDFNDEHKWVRSHALDDMRVVFVTSAVLFSDGSQLGLTP